MSKSGCNFMQSALYICTYSLFSYIFILITFWDIDSWITPVKSLSEKNSFSEELTKTLAKRLVTDSFCSKVADQGRINYIKKTPWKVKSFRKSISQCSAVWSAVSVNYQICWSKGFLCEPRVKKWYGNLWLCWVSHKYLILGWDYLFLYKKPLNPSHKDILKVINKINRSMYLT